jgi:hypothetical protein
MTGRNCRRYIARRPSQSSRKVKFEKFCQLCGIQPAACWEAVGSGKLIVGEPEHPVIMNAARSHLGGGEDFSRGCRYRVGFLDRKATQVLMEILVKKEWIWWSEMAGKIATASGEMVSVSKEGEVVMEDRLRVWAMPSRVGGVDLPAAGGGPAAFN